MLKSKNKKDRQITWIFNEEENASNLQIFKQIAGEKKKTIAEEQLTSYLEKTELGTVYAKKIYEYIHGFDRAKNEVTFEAFTLAMVHIHKGTCYNRAKLLYLMLDEKKLKSLKSLLYMICRESGLYIKLTDSWLTDVVFLHSSYSHSEFIEFLMHVAIHGFKKRRFETKYEINEDFELSEEIVERWLQNLHIVHHMMHYAFGQCFPIDTYSMRSIIPKLVVDKVRYCMFKSLLDYGTMMLIAAYLPCRFRERWTLLFSNKLHGESFSMLMQRVVNKGPFIFVLRDSKDHIFGGYSSEPMKQTTKFYGSPTCFTFSLFPHLDMFMTTGLNDNYLYFNHAIKTIPVGFGMGGQLDFHAIWIDGIYGEGHSRTKTKNTTYGCPVLSSEQNFHFTQLEFWLVSGASVEEKHVPETIISKNDYDVKATMEVADRKLYSDGFKEVDRNYLERDATSFNFHGERSDFEISQLDLESHYKTSYIKPFIDEDRPKQKSLKRRPEENVARQGHPDNPAG